MPEPITADAARQALMADRAEREKRAFDKINQALQEERCQMAPIFVLTTQGMTGRIDITALD
jgi:hypothetical protein